MPISRFILLLLLSGLLACQKPTDGITPTTVPPVTTPQQPGVVYEKGTPQGQSVQKIIGPEGGTLASADSTLLMTIPAGAVSQATGFSMQPVTPTLPGLIGKQSYRLLPEGLTFAKPVTLQFHYEEDDLVGSSSQLLFMAYQGMDGVWNALPDTELDEATRTLTVNTTHFSDWGAFAEFSLLAERDIIKPGESTKLTLVGFYQDITPLVEKDQEVALTQQKVLEDPKNIKNWRVMGKGSIRPDASQVQATYGAPNGSVGGEALVSVEVYNFLPPNRRPRKGASGKAILLKPIRIEGNYFEATLDGQSYICESTGFLDERGLTITADITSPGGIAQPFYAVLPTKSPKALTNYRFHVEGGAQALFSDDGKVAWVAYYDPCGDGDQVNSPGGVHIETVNDHTVGSLHIITVSGSLSVILYDKEDCKVRTKKVTAKFVIDLIDD